jgi:NADH-quinone oxidoreductase subunit L
MGRLLFLTFFGTERFDQHHVHPHESPSTMLVPLVVLAVLSAVGGAFDVPAQVHRVVGVHEAAAGAPIGMLVLAAALAVGGLVLAWYCYVREPALPELASERFAALYALLRDKWRVDELYDAVVVRPVFAFARLGASFFDPYIVDGIVNGTASAVRATSSLWRRLQTGNLQHYALSFVAGALVLLVYYVVR